MSNTNGVRWTPRRIRDALLCPKPKGAIAKVHTSLSDPRRHAVETAVAQFIAQHADLLDCPSAPAFADPWAINGEPCGWLLVPATTWLLDALAEFGAERAEMEPDHDGEESQDEEPDTDGEPDRDDEPDGLVVTDAQRERYRKRTGFSRGSPAGPARESGFIPLRREDG